MKQLYLVRHGENKANLTKEFSCRHIDYDLTPKGVLQSQQTAAHFRDQEIQGIYSSPMKRAMQTAQIIADAVGLEVVPMENFREIDVGDLETKPVSNEAWAFHGLVLEDWFLGRKETAFPGGESYSMLWERMKAGIEEITRGQESGRLLVVGHGGIFTLTLKDLCPEVDTGWLRNADNHNCSITNVGIERQQGQFRGKLLQWAYSGHLSGEAALLVPGVPEPGSLDGAPAAEEDEDEFSLRPGFTASLLHDLMTE